MPRRGEQLHKLGFLTIGRFDDRDPGPGIEETLQTIVRAEALGFNSVWLRDRHLQPGMSSLVAIMAAATQRTSRIELGTAVNDHYKSALYPEPMSWRTSRRSGCCGVCGVSR